jgi:hypothetical protein
MGVYEDVFRNLLHRLGALRQRGKKLRLIEGTLIFLSVFSLLLLTILTIESMFFLGTSARTTVLTVALLLTVAAFLWWVSRPLFAWLFQPNLPDNVHLALSIGDHFAHIKDRLADALQVFEKHRANPEGYSLELADASLRDIDAEMKEIDFRAVEQTDGAKKFFKYFTGCAAALLVGFAVFNATFSSAAFRLMHPMTDFPKYSGVTLRVTPGDLEVVKGENVAIEARVAGASISDAMLVMKPEGARDYQKHELSSRTDSSFSYVIEDIREDVTYFVEAADEKSREYRITVVEPPFVRNLQIKLTYPRYSKLGSQFLDENVGDVSALKGTEVELSLKTNKTVKEAKVVFSDSTEKLLRVAGQDVSGQFRLMQSGAYHIDLLDKQDRPSADPIEYRLTVLEDQSPFVQITFPAQDVDLGEDMLLPLTIEAQDDFGFTKARIGYQILEGGMNERELQYQNLSLPEPSSDKLLINYTWELSKLNIFPEDVVTYFAEVFDNDAVSGPKSSRSSIYRARFPSVHEIYQDIARGQEESVESLEEMYEQSQALREELSQLSQEMKRDPELNWEEKQKVQESAQAQQNMQKELEEVREKLDEIIQRMEQNELASFETLEKYRELQKLMDEMLTPELKEALRELQKSMEDFDPQKMKEAMEKFAASQEEFLKSIERTMNLLKKLQIEQKMDEAVRRAQELMRRQEELNKQASESPSKQNSSKYAQEQQGIRKDSNELSESLDDLKNRMDEFPKMPGEKIESAQNQLDNELQPQMQNSSQQFQSGDMQGGQQSGQQISQGLQELSEMLQSAQQQLSDEQKQEIQQALNRSSNELLNLSKQQEGLMQSTQSMDRNSPGMNDAANSQQDMLSGLSRVTNQLYELSQNTFFVTPEIGKALGKSLSGMQDALRSYEERNSGLTVRNQGQSLSGLNEAVMQIQKSLQSMSGASSGIGFQEMMQRLTGMSGQQQGINQQTSELGEGEGMTMEQQAAMSRLAAEQAGVQKSLEQLLKEAGTRSELLGDLAKVGEEMKEVVGDLESHSVNRNTINQQKRILSRLLDAQRSMHNRDFSKQREAETGKEYAVTSPEALPANLLSQKDMLKNELLKAMKEGYSKDFRELIQKYFDALAKEKQVEELNN